MKDWNLVCKIEMRLAYRRHISNIIIGSVASSRTLQQYLTYLGMQLMIGKWRATSAPQAVNASPRQRSPQICTVSHVSLQHATTGKSSLSEGFPTCNPCSLHRVYRSPGLQVNRPCHDTTKPLRSQPKSPWLENDSPQI